MGRDSSAGIVTRYGLNGPGIESRWPRGLKRSSVAALLLGLQVRIPPREWVFVLYDMDKRQKSGQRCTDKVQREREKIPGGGEISHTRPDRPRGTPSPLYSGYQLYFPGAKRPGRGANHPSHLTPRLKKELSYISTPPLGLHSLFLGRTLVLLLLFLVR